MDQKINLEEKGASCFVEFFFIAVTLLFRIASFCSLIWVFMVIHSRKVQNLIFYNYFQDQWTIVSNKLPTLYLIPLLYFIVFILMNSWSHFAFNSPSRSRGFWAVLSLLVPRPSSSTSLPPATYYLVLNVLSNSMLHALLWAALSSGCPECLHTLSMPAFGTAWPIVLTLGETGVQTMHKCL